MAGLEQPAVRLSATSQKPNTPRGPHYRYRYYRRTGFQFCIAARRRNAETILCMAGLEQPAVRLSATSQKPNTPRGPHYRYRYYRRTGFQFCIAARRRNMETILYMAGLEQPAVGLSATSQKPNTPRGSHYRYRYYRRTGFQFCIAARRRNVKTILYMAGLEQPAVRLSATSQKPNTPRGPHYRYRYYRRTGFHSA